MMFEVLQDQRFDQTPEGAPDGRCLLKDGDKAIGLSSRRRRPRPTADGKGLARSPSDETASAFAIVRSRGGFDRSRGTTLWRHRKR